MTEEEEKRILPLVAYFPPRAELTDFNPSESARACMEVVSDSLLAPHRGKVICLPCCESMFSWVVNEWKYKVHASGCPVLTCFRAPVNENPGPLFSFRCDTCKGEKLHVQFEGRKYRDPCLTCSGSGKNPLSMKPVRECVTCRGVGRVTGLCRCPGPPSYGHQHRVSPCPDCRGSGKNPIGGAE